MASAKFIGISQTTSDSSLLPNHMATDTFEHILCVLSSYSHSALTNNTQPLPLGFPDLVVEAIYGM